MNPFLILFLLYSVFMYIALKYYISNVPIEANYDTGHFEDFKYIFFKVPQMVGFCIYAERRKYPKGATKLIHTDSLLTCGAHISYSCLN